MAWQPTQVSARVGCRGFIHSVARLSASPSGAQPDPGIGAALSRIADAAKLPVGAAVRWLELTGVKVHGAGVFRITGSAVGGCHSRGCVYRVFARRSAGSRHSRHGSIGLAGYSVPGRSPVFVVAALLLIMNQGYWQQTLETLSRRPGCHVRSHRDRSSSGDRMRSSSIAGRRATASTRPHADSANVRIPDSDTGIVWSWRRTGADFDGDFRVAGAYSADATRGRRGAALAARSRRSLRRHALANAVQSGASECRTADCCRGSPSASC